MTVLLNRGLPMFACCLAAVALLAGSTTAADTVVLLVDKVYTGAGGNPIDGPIVIVDGKIARVGGGVPGGATVIDHSGSSACAGFVDALTQLGGQGAFDEPARSVTSDVDAFEAFDPFHDAFDRAVQSGVTMVGLSPSSANLIGGRMAVVRTRTDGEEAGAVGEGPLRMALSRSALQATRTPTSRMGAMHMLRAEVSAGLPGSGSIIIEANSADEIRLALQVLKEAGRPVTLLQPTGADRALATLSGSGARAVLGPYRLTTSTRALRTGGVLDAAAIEVAFTANGNGSALRLTAALAVRAGMDGDAALASITSVPASILGVADSGKIQAGKRGDVLIFDGHPLDLGSKLEAVYCAGVAVDLDD